MSEDRKYSKEEIETIFRMIDWTDVYTEDQRNDLYDVIKMFNKIAISSGASKTLAKAALHEIVNLACGD